MVHAEDAEKQGEDAEEVVIRVLAHFLRALRVIVLWIRLHTGTGGTEEIIVLRPP